MQLRFNGVQCGRNKDKQGIDVCAAKASSWVPLASTGPNCSSPSASACSSSASFSRRKLLPTEVPPSTITSWPSLASTARSMVCDSATKEEAREEPRDECRLQARFEHTPMRRNSSRGNTQTRPIPTHRDNPAILQLVAAKKSSRRCLHLLQVLFDRLAAARGFDVPSAWAARHSTPRSVRSCAACFKSIVRA